MSQIEFLLANSYIGSDRISQRGDGNQEFETKIRNQEMRIEELQQEIRKLKINSRESKHSLPKD